MKPILQYKEIEYYKVYQLSLAFVKDLKKQYLFVYVLIFYATNGDH